MLLNESLTVTSTEISPETREILEIFQEAMGTMYSIYNKNAKQEGRIEDIQHFKELKRSAKRFSNYSFMVPVLKQINRIQKELIDQIQSQTIVNRQKKSPMDIKSAVEAWKSGNITKAIAISNSFTPNINAGIGAAKTPLNYSSNPFYRHSPTFFGTTAFLEVFETAEIEKVINMDLNKFKYSYMPLNAASQNNFEYLGYFMLHLSDTPKQTKLSGQSLSKYFEMTYQDEDFKELIIKVKSYLHDNNKRMLPEIIKGIKNFPKIYQANEQAKQNITTVYRGHVDDDYTPSGYIATSLYKGVARNFALQIGHLESEENRRSDIGYIDTYRVGPDSIILDTTIFGGIFGESEVIIDASKAELIDTETV